MAELHKTRQYIETTANNRIVSADMKRSHFATHLAEQPGLRELTQEAIRHLELTKDDTVEQIDMGRPIGYMDLVKREPGESVIYGRRFNRGSYAPFVDRDGERPLTSSLVVVLRRLGISALYRQSTDSKLFQSNRLTLPQHDLFTAYIGVKTPGLPGGNPKYVTEESHTFWAEHALVLRSQKIEEVYTGLGVPVEYRR